MSASPSKSPYEIRLNTLELAYKIVRDRKIAEYYKNNGCTEVLDIVNITADEVIEEAKKLNAFISSDKKQS